VAATLVQPTRSAARVYARRPCFSSSSVSGYNDPDVLHELLARPGTAFIQKPYLVDELLQRCASLLAQRS
jgi:hypothetical protein